MRHRVNVARSKAMVNFESSIGVTSFEAVSKGGKYPLPIFSFT
jgi:hypothetical protein